MLRKLPKYMKTIGLPTPLKAYFIDSFNYPACLNVKD